MFMNLKPGVLALVIVLAFLMPRADAWQACSAAVDLPLSCLNACLDLQRCINEGGGGCHLHESELTRCLNEVRWEWRVTWHPLPADPEYGPPGALPSVEVKPPPPPPPPHPRMGQTCGIPSFNPGFTVCPIMGTVDREGNCVPRPIEEQPCTRVDCDTVAVALAALGFTPIGRGATLTGKQINKILRWLKKHGYASANATAVLACITLS